jgi:cell wall-associated NlpC family hydrolase
MTPDDFIAAARGMLGTPWHHQGRAPGVGIDCIGLVVCAARQCGIELPDQRGYSRDPHGMLRPTLQAYCGDPVRERAIGDVALFKIVNEPQHVGILTELDGVPQLLHAYLGSRCVVETPLDARWLRRLIAIYRLPELSA